MFEILLPQRLDSRFPPQRIRTAWRQKTIPHISCTFLSLGLLTGEKNGASQHNPENQAQGKGDAYSHGVMAGLDNSGKTTIVMKINGEDTSVISPTLGFNIKTIAYQKYTLNIWPMGCWRAENHKVVLEELF
ncbi:hypothetical protein OROGR_028516 [Orobanche gracilis]